MTVAGLATDRLRPDDEALLLSVHAARDQHRQDRLRQLLGGRGVALTDLLAAAARHEVLPLVAAALEEVHLDSATSSVARSLAAARRQNLIRAMVNHAELQRIGARLAAHSISAVALKGTDLAVRLFDAVDGRQTRDIDILVQASQLAPARRLLRELGYRPYTIAGAQIEAHPFHGAPWVRRVPPLDTVVELHWGLENPRFVRIDYDRLWQRILARRRDREALLSLPGEECLLFLALHLVKSPRGLLRLLADVDRLLRREGPSLDWAYTIELARRWEVCWMLYFTLYWARLFYDTPLPPWTLDRLAPPAWRRVLIGLLVPPHRCLRPPSSERLRWTRFTLARFAMLHSARRTWGSYLAYLFGDLYWLRQSRSGVVSSIMARARRPVSGQLWTMLALAGSATDAACSAVSRRR